MTKKEYLGEIKNILSSKLEFINKYKVSSWTENTHFWIETIDALIGDEIVHYELLLNNNRELSIELHFEGDDFNIFKEKLSDISIDSSLLRNGKRKYIPFSISFKDIIKADNNLELDNIDLIVDEIIKRLDFLEHELGEEVRKIVKELDVNKRMLYNTMKNQPLNQILYGPPGTGKTYNTINKAIGIINPSFDLKQSRDIVKTEYQRLVEEGQIVFTTFHQSMCYEDFIEGIKPQEPVGDDSNLTYKVDDGIFKIICKKAKYISGNLEKVIEEFKDEISEPNGKSPITIKGAGTTFDVIYRGTNVFYVYPHAIIRDKPWYPVNIDNIFKAFETDDYTTVYNPTYIREILKYLVHNRGLQREENIDVEDKKFVLIIDEINRGNVSQIFGELITLIEEDKRLGCDEALEAILPYSKEKFSVPKNLHIIGTMNTADRSVEALDAALRRRFTFEEMPPKPILIKEEGKLKDHNGVLKGIDLVVLLELINKRIEKLLDKDHKIGHSYFMSVETMYDLKQTFQNKIIPLLQEYFYGDYGKIGLVLGAGFFNEDGKQDKEDIFADFNGYDKSMLGRPVYSFKNLMELPDDKFNDVINTLFNNKRSVPVENLSHAQQN